MKTNNLFIAQQCDLAGEVCSYEPSGKSTTILENIETYNDLIESFDPWVILTHWAEDLEVQFLVEATPTKWEQLYFFQLLVREARKDE